MKSLITIILIFSMNSTITLAHDGHKGHGPGPAGDEMIGPHGGTVKKAMHHIMLEFTKDGKNKIKIFPLDHAKKAISVNEVEIVGKVEIPRKGLKELTFKKSGDFIETEVDAQGSHRYELKLEVLFKKHKHNVNFQVEPGEASE